MVTDDQIESLVSDIAELQTQVLRKAIRAMLEEFHDNRRADQVNTEPAVQVPNVCEWRQSDEFEGDTWDGQCGAKWTFTEGGPVENDMHYCPSCGGKLTIRAAQEAK